MQQYEWTEESIIEVLNQLNILQSKYEHKRGNSILVCCPIHNEKNPSMSISFRKGVVHCFGCSYSGTFTQLIYKIYGENKWKEAKEFISKWQDTDSFKFEQLPTRTISPKIEIPVWEQSTTEDELNSYDHTEWTYSKNRGISEQVCRRFRLGFDYDTAMVTFPIIQNGKCICLCKRSIINKQFHIQSGIEKPLAYLEECKSEIIERQLKPQIVMCESMFNALTCWTYGIPAIALLGTGTKIQRELLLRENSIKTVILCFDGDEAGKKATNKWKGWLKDKKIVKVINMPQGKDINDYATDAEQFDQLIGKVYRG